MRRRSGLDRYRGAHRVAVIAAPARPWRLGALPGWPVQSQVGHLRIIPAQRARLIAKPSSNIHVVMQAIFIPTVADVDGGIEVLVDVEMLVEPRHDRVVKAWGHADQGPG